MHRKKIALDFRRLDEDVMRTRAQDFRKKMECRRSVREFSTTPVRKELIEEAIRTAGTAPSGAHRQPWMFVAVDDPRLKSQIRIEAEREEFQSYSGRMPAEWLDALAPLGTDWRKPHLETAPWLVVCFAQQYARGPEGARHKNYYVSESVGIACGLFIAAIHNMGLTTLTHTPSPMRFLSDILGRPENERPYVVFPVGYPAPDAEVPDLKRKSLSEISQWNLE